MDEWKNKLYFGDNLTIMREHIQDESVDLIYLDPPFNSKATYNVLFREKNGTDSAAQITAFEDTWHWDIQSEETYHELVLKGPKKLADLIQAFRLFLGQNDMMAYLTMMSVRLVEMHRILKSTGSIYLHCDPTASHYLKMVMDAVFGIKNYKNEIVWCYKSRPFSKKYFCKKHDTIFFYSKTDKYHFDWQANLHPLSPVTIKKYKYEDKKGKYRLVGRGIKGSPIESAKDVDPKWEKEHPELVVRDYLKDGYPIEDWWIIDIINQVSKERLGYPTQKPESLLERIIKASSNEGDIVLDPFCGCGTTIAVAEKLHRRWVGIDITHLAIALMKHRLESAFGAELSPFTIIGAPKDLESARSLAEQNRYQFEWWALSLVGARPAQDKRKGSDKGIDGYIFFFDDESGKAKKIVVQVKSGHVTASQIRDLSGVVERENAAIGAFITLREPTRPMIEEAASAGFYETEITISKRDMLYPKIQIATIEELLSGKYLAYPEWSLDATHKKAERKKKNNNEEQIELL